MINIEQVKSFLNIDFSDNDDYIQGLIGVANDRAMSITGIEDSSTFNDEIKNAMLEDIAFMYQNRGGDPVVHIGSIATYRRYSKHPMF